MTSLLPHPCRNQMKGFQSCEPASNQMSHGTAQFHSMAMCTLSFWTTTDLEGWVTVGSHFV